MKSMTDGRHGDGQPHPSSAQALAIIRNSPESSPACRRRRRDRHHRRRCGAGARRRYSRRGASRTGVMRGMTSARLPAVSLGLESQRMSFFDLPITNASAGTGNIGKRPHHGWSPIPSWRARFPNTFCRCFRTEEARSISPEEPDATPSGWRNRAGKSRSLISPRPESNRRGRMPGRSRPTFTL